MISHAKEMTLHNFKALLRLNMTFWSMSGVLYVTGAPNLVVIWEDAPHFIRAIPIFWDKTKNFHHVEKIMFVRCVSQTLFVWAFTRWFEGSWKSNKK